MSSSSSGRKSTKNANVDEKKTLVVVKDDGDAMPEILDPFAGVSFTPEARKILSLDRMQREENARKQNAQYFDEQLRVAINRANAEGRDPRYDHEVQQLTRARLSFQINAADSLDKFDSELLAQQAAHATAHVKSATTRVPSERLAAHAFLSGRQVPDDQTAHVMWARALSFFNKYAQVIAIQNMSTRDGARKHLYIPSYHNYYRWIEQYFRIPIVFVRRNSCAVQTWLGEQDRQPLFYMQSAFGVPMPQNNAHRAFRSDVSQNDDLMHEVRYLNMLELVALALLSTARPAACFESSWDTTLPGVDAYDVCPDAAAGNYRFAWSEQKARNLGDSAKTARQHIFKHFPEQRVEIYETFLRFDRQSFLRRGATFDDNADAFRVTQHREVLFDQFYYNAFTFVEPGEDDRTCVELHTEMRRLFRCRDADLHAYNELFPRIDQVLALLQGDDEFSSSSSSSFSSSSSTNARKKSERDEEEKEEKEKKEKERLRSESVWRERRQTSPFYVAVDRDSVINDESCRGGDDDRHDDCKENDSDNTESKNSDFAFISLEEYTRASISRRFARVVTMAPEAGGVQKDDESAASASDSLNPFRELETGDVPLDGDRMRQKTDESTRFDRKKLNDAHRDITELPYYAAAAFNLDRVDSDAVQWALPTSNVKPRRVSKYQYFRAFLYLAIRAAQARFEADSDFSAAVLPLGDVEAMKEIRKWIGDRRKRQRQVPNYRAWAADVLKGANAWMTRVLEAVEMCFLNDPGRTSEKKTKEQLSTAENSDEQKKNDLSDIVDDENAEKQQNEPVPDEKRCEMWRRVEALFPPGIVSLSPPTQLKDRIVPPPASDAHPSSSSSSSSSFSSSSTLLPMRNDDDDEQTPTQRLNRLIDEKPTHVDAFGVPTHAVSSRLFQELFVNDEGRHTNWLTEFERGGTQQTMHWEDSQRQKELRSTGCGAPTRIDRLNPLLCSRHFRNVVLPAGGVTAPAFVQREDWLPALFRAQPNAERGERGEKPRKEEKKEKERGEKPRKEEKEEKEKEKARLEDVEEEKDWQSMRVAYARLSEQLFPSTSRARTAPDPVTKHANNSDAMFITPPRRRKKPAADIEEESTNGFAWNCYRDENFYRRIIAAGQKKEHAAQAVGGEKSASKDRAVPRKYDEFAELLGDQPVYGNSTNKFDATKKTVLTHKNDDAHRRESDAKSSDLHELSSFAIAAAQINDTVTPADAVKSLFTHDKNYDKRHPNIVHEDVFGVADGDQDGFSDALFSIVCEPLLDARFLHTHPQPDHRGVMDRESHSIFFDSVQRPLAHNSFYQFFRIIVDVCCGEEISGLDVGEWEQVEQFCRRVLYAYEAVEFDQSHLLGDDRFVFVDRNGLLQPNQDCLPPTGEQPREVQAAVRAMQTFAYATRMAHLTHVLERVEKIMSYVPWIQRNHVLQSFEGDDCPFSMLYDYGVNAILSMPGNADLRPRGFTRMSPSVATETANGKKENEDDENADEQDGGGDYFDSFPAVFSTFPSAASSSTSSSSSSSSSTFSSSAQGIQRLSYVAAENKTSSVQSSVQSTDRKMLDTLLPIPSLAVRKDLANTAETTTTTTTTRTSFNGGTRENKSCENYGSTLITIPKQIFDSAASVFASAAAASAAPSSTTRRRSTSRRSKDSSTNKSNRDASENIAALHDFVVREIKTRRDRNAPKQDDRAQRRYKREQAREIEKIAGDNDDVRKNRHEKRTTLEEATKKRGKEKESLSTVEQQGKTEKEPAEEQQEEAGFDQLRDLELFFAENFGGWTNSKRDTEAIAQKPLSVDEEKESKNDSRKEENNAACLLTLNDANHDDDDNDDDDDNESKEKESVQAQDDSKKEDEKPLQNEEDAVNEFVCLLNRLPEKERENFLREMREKVCFK